MIATTSTVEFLWTLITFTCLMLNLAGLISSALEAKRYLGPSATLVRRITLIDPVVRFGANTIVQAVLCWLGVRASLNPPSGNPGSTLAQVMVISVALLLMVSPAVGVWSRWRLAKELRLKPNQESK